MHDKTCKKRYVETNRQKPKHGNMQIIRKARKPKRKKCKTCRNENKIVWEWIHNNLWSKIPGNCPSPNWKVGPGGLTDQPSQTQTYQPSWHNHNGSARSNPKELESKMSQLLSLKTNSIFILKSKKLLKTKQKNQTNDIK